MVRSRVLHDISRDLTPTFSKAVTAREMQISLETHFGQLGTSTVFHLFKELFVLEQGI